MENVSRGNDWDLNEATKQRQIREADNIRYVTKLSAQWQKSHEGKVKEAETALLREHPQASADEKLLLHLVAHDSAISEALGKVELQVAQRLLLLIDNVRTAVALAKVLKQVVACREVTERRAHEVLQAAGIIRGQRRMRESVPLRRVA